MRIRQCHSDSFFFLATEYEQNDETRSALVLWLSSQYTHKHVIYFFQTQFLRKLQSNEMKWRKKNSTTTLAKEL